MTTETAPTLDLTKPRKGSQKVMTIRGVPLFIHWSFPAGGLFLSAFAGFAPVHIVSYVVAFSALIALHELAHMAAAVALHHRVYGIHISGVGGQCVIQAPRGIRDTTIIFSAGLLTQAILLVATIVYTAHAGPPQSVFGQCLFNTFTIVNFVVLVLNLIPGKIAGGFSTDGAVLWTLLVHVVHGGPHPFPNPLAATIVLPPETRLQRLDNFVPTGFTTGVEILNDATTPMEFVVDVLVRHLNLGRDEAIQPDADGTSRRRPADTARQLRTGAVGCGGRGLGCPGSRAPAGLPGCQRRLGRVIFWCARAPKNGAQP